MANEYILYLTIGLAFLLLVRRSLTQMVYRSIFRPKQEIEKTPKDFDLDFEEATFCAKDGTKLHGWFIPHPKPIATILFLHGNTGNISGRIHEISLWHHINMSVFIIDYRGYGKSLGTPTEKGLYSDAWGAYNFLLQEKKIPAEKIVCFGRSLGGAIAINLAMRVKLGALIVSSTFTNIKSMLCVYIPRPLANIVSFFIPVRMPSLALIPYLKSPLLVFHGDSDKIIPPHMGKELYDQAPNPKMWYSISGADHNNVFIKGGKKYWYVVKAFIQKTIEGKDSKDVEV